MIRAPLLSACAALALSACAVGPSHVSPLPAAPAQGPFAAASPAVRADAPAGAWWRLYDDPTLDALVADALAANTDLRAAAANLSQARASLREARAGFLPATTVGASAGTGRASASAATGAAQALPDVDSYDAGLDVGYQADLFGRLRRAAQASSAEAEAVKAAYDLARVTVAGETARAYADACSAARRLDVAQRSLELQAETLGLTRRLLDAGGGDGLDVARAAALADQTRAAIPALQAQRQAALYRLSVLTGRPPADIPAAAASCRRPPVLAQPLPVGDGAGLLARRPDVRQAERRLAAATARIGVAAADLFPNVSIGASVGSSARSAGDLGSDAAYRFSVGPLIQWSFPNLLAGRARLAQAEAGAQAALASFDGVWLRALQETETALDQYARDLDRRAALEDARDNSAEAARLARLRYDAGRDSFLVMLDADRTLSQAEAALAEAEAQVAADQIRVFMALGGGWEASAA